jgi:hypothetical protein
LPETCGTSLVHVREGDLSGIDRLAALATVGCYAARKACDDIPLVEVIIPILATFAFVVSMVYMLVRNYRYSLLERRSQEWPLVEAVIQKGEAVYRRPFLALSSGKLPESLLGYSYTVAGLRHFGFFAVYRESGISALALQERFAGRKMSVRYDPDCPNRSFIVEREILGKPIYQNPDWLPASIRFPANS